MASDVYPTTDSGRLWKETHDRVLQALSGIGQDAAEKYAQKLANGVVSQYDLEIKKGTPPGAALQVAQSWEKTWTESAQRSNNITPAAPAADTSSVGGNEVQGADVKNAVDVYRETTAGALDKFKNPTGITMPNPVGGVFKPVEAAPVSPAQRFTAALQDKVAIGNTDTTALAATAAGGGAAGQAAAARWRQALLSTGQSMNARAAQARGADRKSARIASISGQGEAGVAAETANQAQLAQDALAAQTKIADLDAAKKQAQATLDQARASGDQNAINQATQKLAELDQQNAQFNSGQAVTVATTNNQQGLQAQNQQESQRVANEELKIKIQEAAQKAAQGLLDEAQREENLKVARQQLANSERAYADAVRRQAQQDELARLQADRSFWGGMISSLVSGAVTIGASAITKSDRNSKENIEPVSDRDLRELKEAARRSLATFTYKDAKDGVGLKAFPMAQDLEATKLGKTVVTMGADGHRRVDVGKLNVLFALADVKSRKAAN